MNIRPLSDHVVVKPVDQAEKRQNGIVIPDSAKEKPAEGEVFAVGPGNVKDDGKRIPMEVKKGNHVLFGKYSGTEITVGGKDYLIMRESDILAIL